MKMRLLIDNIAKFRFYFVRGHGQWFALALSLINFTLIFYNFLWKELFFVPNLLKNYYIFALLFLSVYLPVSVFIGFFDYKRGMYNVEVLELLKVHPVWRKLFQEIEELKELMS